MCKVYVFQVLIKQGELMKLSRKDMQPRMFFLVSPPRAFCAWRGLLPIEVNGPGR